MLTCAGLRELVVASTDEYVNAAIRLANDEPFRQGVVERLREFGAGWFDDPRPAAELETFWLAQASSR